MTFNDVGYSFIFTDRSFLSGRTLVWCEQYYGFTAKLGHGQDIRMYRSHHTSLGPCLISAHVVGNAWNACVTLCSIVDYFSFRVKEG